MTSSGLTAHVQVTLASPVWLPRALPLLDDVEQARLARLRRPIDRDAYLTRHLLARLVLGRRLGMHPAALHFTRDCPTCAQPHGKPRLAAARLCFNLSGTTSRPSPGATAQGLVAVAVVTDVSRERQDHSSSERQDRRVGRNEFAVNDAHDVGIDLETVASTRFEDFDEVALHGLERAELEAMPHGSRAASRATWWARKEALVKALGDGLRIDPATIATTAPAAASDGSRLSPRLLEPYRWPHLALADLHVAGLQDAHVRVAALEPAERVVGAVCVLGVDRVRVTVEPGLDLARDLEPYV